MEKVFIICALLNVLLIRSTLADINGDLKSRLDKVDNFYAKFTQSITDIHGNIIHQSNGDLWVKRPNLFNWHITKPDESILISDGKTLWFYNPLIKQVTAFWLKDIINNTILMLIFNSRSNYWQQYDIKQKNNDFVLTPKINNSNRNIFSINISLNGIINQFSIIDYNGYHSYYELKSQKKCEISLSKFKFILSNEIEVDDQRIENEN